MYQQLATQSVREVTTPTYPEVVLKLGSCHGREVMERWFFEMTEKSKST